MMKFNCKLVFCFQFPFIEKKVKSRDFPGRLSIISSNSETWKSFGKNVDIFFPNFCFLDIFFWRFFFLWIIWNICKKKSSKLEQTVFLHTFQMILRKKIVEKIFYTFFSEIYFFMVLNLLKCILIYSWPKLEKN